LTTSLEEEGVEEKGFMFPIGKGDWERIWNGGKLVEEFLRATPTNTEVKLSI